MPQLLAFPLDSSAYKLRVRLNCKQTMAGSSVPNSNGGMLLLTRLVLMLAGLGSCTPPQVRADCRFRGLVPTVLSYD